MLSLDSMVIDPHDGGSIGLPKPSFNAKLTLVTHQHFDHDAVEVVGGKALVKYYGSTSLEGFRIVGVRGFHDKEKGRRRGEVAMYLVERNDFKVVHLGDLGCLLNESQMKELSSPDVLALPVGGVITIDWKEAADLVRALKPKAVIPLHYWVKGHLMPLDKVSPFLEELKWKTIQTRNVNEEELASQTIYLPF